MRTIEFRGKRRIIVPFFVFFSSSTLLYFGQVQLVTLYGLRSALPQATHILLIFSSFSFCLLLFWGYMRKFFLGISNEIIFFDTSVYSRSFGLHLVVFRGLIDFISLNQSKLLLLDNLIPFSLEYDVHNRQIYLILSGKNPNELQNRISQIQEYFGSVFTQVNRVVGQDLKDYFSEIRETEFGEFKLYLRKMKVSIITQITLSSNQRAEDIGNILKNEKYVKKRLIMPFITQKTIKNRFKDFQKEKNENSLVKDSFRGIFVVYELETSLQRKDSKLLDFVNRIIISKESPNLWNNYEISPERFSLRLPSKSMSTYNNEKGLKVLFHLLKRNFHPLDSNEDIFEPLSQLDDEQISDLPQIEQLKENMIIQQDPDLKPPSIAPYGIDSKESTKTEPLSKNFERSEPQTLRTQLLKIKYRHISEICRDLCEIYNSSLPESLRESICVEYLTNAYCFLNESNRGEKILRSRKKSLKTVLSEIIELKPGFSPSQLVCILSALSILERERFKMSSGEIAEYISSLEDLEISSRNLKEGSIHSSLGQDKVVDDREQQVSS